MKTPQPFLSRLLARTPAEGDAPPEAAEYTVDELAREAGTTVRNLRAYQDRGLLPPPERRGRVGIYNGGHLSRLLLIGQLLERGYSIASIRELLEAWEQGRDLAHVLGLDAAIAGAWGQPEPTRLGFDELIALFGEALTDDTLDRARELGLVEFAGDHLRVLNPRIFNAGVQLHRSGIPLAVLLEQFALIRQQVAPVADGIVGMIVPPGQPAAQQQPAPRFRAGGAEPATAGPAAAGGGGGGQRAGAGAAGVGQPGAGWPCR